MTDYSHNQKEPKQESLSVDIEQQSRPTPSPSGFTSESRLDSTVSPVPPLADASPPTTPATIVPCFLEFVCVGTQVHQTESGLRCSENKACRPSCMDAFRTGMARGIEEDVMRLEEDFRLGF